MLKSKLAVDVQKLDDCSKYPNLHSLYVTDKSIRYIQFSHKKTDKSTFSYIVVPLLGGSWTTTGDGTGRKTSCARLKGCLPVTNCYFLPPPFLSSQIVFWIKGSRIMWFGKMCKCSRCQRSTNQRKFTPYKVAVKTKARAPINLALRRLPFQILLLTAALFRSKCVQVYVMLNQQRPLLLY